MVSPSGSNPDTAFTGSIAEIYDRLFVPLLFEGYALDIARRVARARPMRVLETAAGTGVVTRALIEALPSVEITATDLNQTMLDVAATRSSSPRVQWRQADALDLPFEDASFDVVVCQFGVMFFPDRVAAYREARRVLGPGGRFIFNTWDRLETNEVPLAVTEAITSMFPLDPPSIFRRIPHGYYDLDTIAADVRAAGFGDVQLETLALRSRAHSARDAALALCTGTLMRTEIEERDPSSLDAAVERATAAVAARFGATDIDGKIQAHVVAARS